MMEMTEIQQKLSAFLPKIQLCFEESLAKHTSFRIGGPAEVMAFPKTVQELSQLLQAAAECGLQPRILGAGTNILAPDAGVEGLVICLKDQFGTMERLEGNRIRVSAGVTMARAAVFAANQGLSGMEFAHGIPGTVGGGVYMNAGAYSGEIRDICTRVEVMDQKGNIRAVTGEEMDFSYRHSCLQETEEIVLSAEFSLSEKPVSEIKAYMQELMGKRRASQPLDLPSAGSAFKRPVGAFAAALIDQTGLKGFRIGDAAVSEKHAGFVVNLGNARAEDVKALLSQVSQRVLDHTGFHLEPEIRIW